MPKKYNIQKVHRILFWKKKKYFIKSLFVQTKSLSVDFIPLNEVYKEYCLEKKCLENKKDTQTYLPVEIGENKISISNKTPSVNAFLLKNVMVTGNSSLFLTSNKKKVFYEKLHTDDNTIYLYNDVNLQFHSESLAKIRNFPVEKHNYDVLYMGGLFTCNYYHFIIEILSKTQYINKIPNFKSLKIVLDISIKKNKNLKTLADFFFKDFDIEYLENKSYHLFNNLWFITTPNPTIPNIVQGFKYEAWYTRFSSLSIKYVLKICMDNYDKKQGQMDIVKKVFIARKSSFRKYNEGELINIASKHGFKAVYFEDLNLHEQIFIMQNADYIIGPSGAAWTNIIFTQNSNAKGLIWLGNVWGDFSVFSTLAEIVDFNLYHLRFDSPDATFHSEYNLSPIVFEETLKKLLENEYTSNI